MNSNGKTNVADLRLNYTLGDLSEEDLPTNPMQLFQKWFDDALTAQVVEPNAMTLSTVSADGQPSARTVLLKAIEEHGFTFFSNYESRKGKEIAHNAKVALVFFWRECERQVCVRGAVTRLDRESSEAYFYSRPYNSQIGAWVSLQSSEIASREWLDQREVELKAQYPEGTVPMPPYWGGFLVKPSAIEFWQGRPSRLHDRIEYQLLQDQGWHWRRLSP